MLFSSTPCTYNCQYFYESVILKQQIDPLCIHCRRALSVFDHRAISSFCCRSHALYEILREKKNNEWMNEMNCGSITLEEMWNGVRRKKNGCLRRKLRRRTAFSADRRPLSAACLFLRWKPAIECTGSFKGVTRRGSYSTLSEILPAVCRGSVHTLRTMRLPCRNKSWVQCGIKGKG